MDDNTLTNSSNQHINSSKDDNKEFDNNFHMFNPILQLCDKYRHKNITNGPKKKALKHTLNKKLRHKIKFKYSRLFRKSKKYINKLVRSVVTTNKKIQQAQNEVIQPTFVNNINVNTEIVSQNNNEINIQNNIEKNNVNHIDKPINKNNGSSTTAKDEFYRKIGVIKSYYDELPIIKSKNSPPILNCMIQELKDKNNPVLIETSEGLDIKFNLAILIDILSCSLCKGLFYNAHTIKECMHTFCKSCLILSTIENGLVCPICFTVIHSDINEGIEYDHNIQGLVDKIFPEFIERERKQKIELDRLLGRKVSDIPSDQSYIHLMDAKLNDKNNLIDSTKQFLIQIIEQYDNITSLFDNVLCLALIHESDNELKEIFKNIKAHLDDFRIAYTEMKEKYPRKYICVPKTLYISHIMKYLVHELSLDPEYNIVFMIKNAILSKNHTVEFICKSRRIDMSKCVIFRYKVTFETQQ